MTTVGRFIFATVNIFFLVKRVQLNSMVTYTSCYDNKLIIGSGRGLETQLQRNCGSRLKRTALTIGNYRDTARSYRFFYRTEFTCWFVYVKHARTRPFVLRHCFRLRGKTSRILTVANIN